MTRYALIGGLIVRGTALCNLIAFATYGVQIGALNGANGIIPAGSDPAIAALPMALRQWQAPSLFWYWPTDGGLHAICVAGAVASFLALLGISPAPCLLVCWACYLSLGSVAGAFMQLQWDTLLVETTFLAVWLAAWRPRPVLIEPPPWAVLAMRFLAFRLMWMSGIVKLRSGDPTWHDFTALTYHYWTQPLPNPLSPLFSGLSESFHVLSAQIMFVSELTAPFLLFGPREGRRFAFVVFAALLGLLFLTGNYGFFQILSLVVCASALDDDAIRPLLARIRLPEAASTHVVARTLVAVAAIAAIALGSLKITSQILKRDRLPDAAGELLVTLAPFRTVNNYGLFATMTTVRPELIFEGSDDQRTWHAYELPYKPGDLDRRLPIVAPYMPRLDWQLWFAALGSCAGDVWVIDVMNGLHEGDPAVLGLFATDPFTAKPPRYVRVRRFLYTLTGGDAPPNAEIGRVWTRVLIDEGFCPMVGE